MPLPEAIHYFVEHPLHAETVTRQRVSRSGRPPGSALQTYVSRNREHGAVLGQVHLGQYAVRVALVLGLCIKKSISILHYL